MRHIIALMLALMIGPALAHDYERPELAPWFMQLRSGKGPCCDGKDATHLSDVDWESKDGHYRVRIDGQWVDVPDEAVLNEPNLDGQTLVWIWYRDGKPQVRCFMAGAGG